PGGEARLELLDGGAPANRGLESLRHDAARLNVLVHLLHEQPRLALALGEEDPRGLTFQALEHGAERGRKRIPDLACLHCQLQRRVILHPASLVRQKLEGNAWPLVLGRWFVVPGHLSLVPGPFVLGHLSLFIFPGPLPLVRWPVIPSAARNLALTTDNGQPTTDNRLLTT